MLTFDKENSFNCNIVAGIDEAGRGPLCGPVYSACAIILDKNSYIADINDSKKLTEHKREKIFNQILELEKERKIIFGIGTASVDEIDIFNIREATKLAMKRSYENLIEKYNIKPNLVIVDGNFVPNIDNKTEYVIKGDATCPTIATASIIAKVSRDKLLYDMDKEFPQYNWKSNKGYGTKEHMEAIKQYGICKYHRRSFVHI